MWNKQRYKDKNRQNSTIFKRILSMKVFVFKSVKQKFIHNLLTYTAGIYLLPITCVIKEMKSLEH